MSNELSNDPPTALPYESPRSAGPDDAFWRVFRFGVTAWSATMLVRHASYWGGVAIGSGVMRFDLRPASFAAIECVFLTLILVNGVTLRRASRSSHASLAGLCAGYIVISSVGWVFDVLPIASVNTAMMLRVLWLAASRVQICVVPAMAIVGFGWSKKR